MVSGPSLSNACRIGEQLATAPANAPANLWSMMGIANILGQRGLEIRIIDDPGRTDARLVPITNFTQREPDLRGVLGRNQIAVPTAGNFMVELLGLLRERFQDRAEDEINLTGHINMRDVCQGDVTRARIAAHLHLDVDTPAPASSDVVAADVGGVAADLKPAATGTESTAIPAVATPIAAVSPAAAARADDDNEIEKLIRKIEALTQHIRSLSSGTSQQNFMDDFMRIKEILLERCGTLQRSLEGEVEGVAARAAEVISRAGFTLSRAAKKPGAPLHAKVISAKLIKKAGKIYKQLKVEAEKRGDQAAVKTYLDKAGYHFSMSADDLARVGRASRNPARLKRAAQRSKEAGNLRYTLAEIFKREENYEEWTKLLEKASLDFNLAGESLALAGEMQKSSEYYQAAAEQEDRAAEIRKTLAEYYKDDYKKCSPHLRRAARYRSFAASCYANVAAATADAQNLYRAAADRSEDSVGIQKKLLDHLSRGTPEWEKYLGSAARELSFAARYRELGGELETAVRLKQESGQMSGELAKFFRVTRREKWEEYLADAARAYSLAGRYLSLIAQNTSDATLYEEAARLRERAEGMRRELAQYFRGKDDEKFRQYAGWAEKDAQDAQSYRAAAERLRGA